MSRGVLSVKLDMKETKSCGVTSKFYTVYCKDFGRLKISEGSIFGHFFWSKMFCKQGMSVYLFRVTRTRSEEGWLFSQAYSVLHVKSSPSSAILLLFFVDNLLVLCSSVEVDAGSAVLLY